MFKRVAGSGSARGDLDFPVDGGEVVIDGAGADDELVGDLHVSQTLSEETEDFDFAGGEVIGIGR